MKSPFIHKLPDSNGPQLGVLPRTRNRGSRQVAQKRKRPIALMAKSMQILNRLLARVAPLSISSILIVSLERRRITLHHFLHPLAKSQHLDVRQMRQHLANRPTIRRRLPLQLIAVSQMHNLLDDDRRLLQHRKSRQTNFRARSGHRQAPRKIKFRYNAERRASERPRNAGPSERPVRAHSAPCGAWAPRLRVGPCVSEASASPSSVGVEYTVHPGGQLGRRSRTRGRSILPIQNRGNRAPRGCRSETLWHT